MNHVNEDKVKIVFFELVSQLLRQLLRIYFIIESLCYRYWLAGFMQLEFYEDYAQRVNVRFGVILAFLEYLRSSIVLAVNRSLRTILDLDTDTQVSQLDNYFILFFPEQNVWWFYVSVDDTVSMQVGNGIDQLVYHLVHIEIGIIFNMPLQSTQLTILHDDEIVVAHKEALVAFEDIFMFTLSQELGFPQYPYHVFRSFCIHVGHLDSHGLALVLVTLCQKDLPETSGSDFMDEFDSLVRLFHFNIL